MPMRLWTLKMDAGDYARGLGESIARSLEAVGQNGGVQQSICKDLDDLLTLFCI